MMTTALHMSINNNMQLMICSSDRSVTRVGSLGVPPRDTPKLTTALFKSVSVATYT